MSILSTRRRVTIANAILPPGYVAGVDGIFQLKTGSHWFNNLIEDAWFIRRHHKVWENK